MQTQAYTKLQSAAGRVSASAEGGLVAAAVGTTNDAVLNFLTAPTVEGVSPDQILAANDAALGTSIILRTPGIYQIELYVEILADAVIPIVGISQDCAAAALIGAPSFVNAGMLDVQAPVVAVVTAAGFILPLKICTTAEVSDQQANQDVGGIVGSIIRFHSAIAAGSTPAAGLVQTAPYYRVRRRGSRTRPPGPRRGTREAAKL